LAADHSETAGHGENLSKLAWASRDDHRPISDRQITALRQRLREQAHKLEQALASQGHLFTQQWKRYLKWDRLEQPLSLTAKIDRRTLTNLDQVLQQFRRNQPGLERLEFTRTAKAIEQLRVTLPWAMAAQTRDPRKDYRQIMTTLRTQLQRHQAEATSETEWKIGRVMGLVNQLGQSALLVEALHESLVQPNFLVDVSEAFIQQIVQRPIHNTRPVRDCILGTSITGTAQTTGSVHLRTLPSRDTIQLEVRLTGNTRSRTQGHQHPVRIRNSSNTQFFASKRISLDADSFQASPAVVHANTQTTIHSIRKTGCPLGHRLIERIAWKKSGQSKGCAEQIASRHAEARIGDDFDEQLAEALARARNNYVQKIRDPLLRRNMMPTHLHMSSQPDRVRIETTFASRSQLASTGTSPRLTVTSDLTVRIHQSAVNNYLALVLAGATIEQETEDQPPRLSGNLPPWMSKVSLGDRFRHKRSSAKDSPVAAEEATGTVRRDQEDFQPWSITLNSEQPVNVRFDQQQLVLRMRASRLTSLENEYKNWDFILRYDVIPQGNTILLRRSGKIEVFPTGFDPRWDKRMSSAKSGFRSTLAKNMNARADRGESFPDEIPLQPIRLPERLGIQGELTLRFIDCDNHWLTLSWQLP
jgi:hypothetical protein